MIKFFVLSFFYNASLGYNGLAFDFFTNGKNLWVSFPLENKVLNYETGFEIKVKNPTVILQKNDFLYIISNTQKKIYVYKDKIFSHNIKLPEGDYVSGHFIGNSIFLLSREPAGIIKVNERNGYNFTPINSYKPVDFKFFEDKFYVLDRKGPAPKIRVITLDREGTFLSTLIDIPGNFGGGIEIKEIDGKNFIFLSNSLMGKIYIYSLNPINKIDSIGTYGDSILEFKTPTKVKFIGDKLYILNQRNSRIDIFSLQNSFLLEVSETIGKPFDDIKLINNSLLLNLKIPDGNYLINIFSLDGRKVLKIDNIKIKNGYIEKEIPLSLSKGIYFFMIKEKNGKFFLKKGVNFR